MNPDILARCAPCAQCDGRPCYVTFGVDDVALCPVCHLRFTSGWRQDWSNGPGGMPTRVRACENCAEPLPVGWPAVYCSNECANEDA